ncbi:MAG: hypothetical protein AAF548_19000 [Actinomycetota bacterium]
MTAVALLAAACGGDSFDRDDAISDLESGGFSNAEATCIVDGVADEFGIAKLESNDDLTEEDSAKLTEITTGCLGATIPDAGGDDAGGDGEVSLGGDTDVSDLYYEGQFDIVCNGAGVSAAAGYTAGDGVPAMVVMQGEAPSFNPASTLVPDEWQTPFDALETTELVVCVDRTASSAVEVCTGYEDEGLSWEVETFNATYDVTVRDAVTAEVLQATTLEAQADGCPMFSFYTEGDPSPVADYADPTDSLEAFLAPVVTG